MRTRKQSWAITELFTYIYNKTEQSKNEKSSPEMVNIVISYFSLFIDMRLSYLRKWFDFSEDTTTGFHEILPNISLKNAVVFKHFEMVIIKARLQDKLNIKIRFLYFLSF